MEVKYLSISGRASTVYILWLCHIFAGVVTVFGIQQRLYFYFSLNLLFVSMALDAITMYRVA